MIAYVLYKKTHHRATSLPASHTSFLSSVPYCKGENIGTLPKMESLGKHVDFGVKQP